MKLATIRTADGTRAVRVDGDDLVDLGAADLGDFLAREDWKDAAAAATDVVGSASDAEYATLVAQPSKVVCVGLNYATHITEMGRPLPEYPTLFHKFSDTLIGANDPIARPEETEQFDWEAELVVVIGKPVRRAKGKEAEEAIAGFTVMNDITCRDWQFRTREWSQGKNWDASTPVGPVMVTPDELPGGIRPALAITTHVDGELMQNDNTGDLVHDPVFLVEYVSTMIRLNPGDMIASGTPGGVGHARKPAVYLQVGQEVSCAIEGIGSVTNKVVAG
mgnify:CR=1 FL=1